MQLIKHLQNREPRRRVKVPRRLVRHDDRGVIHQRPRDRDALLLPARKLAWAMIAALVQSHAPNRRQRLLSPNVRRDALIKQRHLDVFVNDGELPEEEEEEEVEDKEFLDMVHKPISELELSVRSANCLEAANIKTIGDLIQKSEGQMLKYKNFGKKSLNEINAILVTMNLHLGMNIEDSLPNKGASLAQTE